MYQHHIFHYQVHYFFHHNYNILFQFFCLIHINYPLYIINSFHKFFSLYIHTHLCKILLDLLRYYMDLHNYNNLLLNNIYILNMFLNHDNHYLLNIFLRRQQHFQFYYKLLLMFLNILDFREFLDLFCWKLQEWYYKVGNYQIEKNRIEILLRELEKDKYWFCTLYLMWKIIEFLKKSLNFNFIMIKK